MPLPALQKFERGIERQLRLLEVRKIVIERKIECVTPPSMNSRKRECP